MIELLKIRKPQVSIVLPTYNREGYLPEAIESVLQQSFQDFELIIIDDGSTDRSEDVIRAYEDQRIVYVLQRNQGEFITTNTGLRMAQGEYLTWIHSDDIMPPDSLMHRVNCLNENREVDFCHGDIEIIDQNGNKVQHFPASESDGLTAFKGYFKPVRERTPPWAVHHTTIMFRRAFIEKVGYWDERLPCAADFDWLLRALRRGRMRKVPGILYWYRDHPGTRRQKDIRNRVALVVRFILNRRLAR